jgi:hypothetical protein
MHTISGKARQGQQLLPSHLFILLNQAMPLYEGEGTEEPRATFIR